MKRCLTLMHRALLSAAVVLSLPLSAGAALVPVQFVFDGAGGLSYNPGAGTGTWMGTLVDLGFVGSPPMLPALTSQVSFSLSGVTLSGMFEFANGAANLLTGQVSGTVDDADLSDGGQLLLDYTVAGGTGQFANATGFAISILDFAPAINGVSAYTEVATGELQVQQIPEPAGWTLASMALLALLATRRKVAPLN